MNARQLVKVRVVAMGQSLVLQLDGAASLGSLSEALKDAGYTPGDRLALIPLASCNVTLSELNAEEMRHGK